MSEKPKRTIEKWRGPTKKKYYRVTVEKVFKPKPYKQCIRCKRRLPINCFYIVNRSPDGLDSYCKECRYFEVELPIKENFKKRYEEYKKRREEEERANNNFH